MTRRIREWFPDLRRGEWRETSPANPHYNCIAWAAGDSVNWWQPGGYWPEGAPEEFTLQAVVAVFETLGYETTEDDLFSEGIERVALFCLPNGTPTHAARQVGPELWTSKLGKGHDIEHQLRAIEGERYGEVAVIMERPLPETAD